MKTFRSFGCIPLFATVALFACSDGTTDPEGGAESPKPGLTLLAGHNLTDTIDARPAQGLVVQFIGENGRAEAGVQVRFEAPVGSRMLVSGVGSESFTTVTSAVTDASGRATVRTRFGTSPGDGWIAVSLPLAALTDTARFKVLPGNPVRVQLAPRDTVLLPGAGFTIRSSTVDRVNNPRQDPAEYSVVGTVVTVSNDGRVTARDGAGVALIRARASVGANTVTDSISVAIMPTGELAWTANQTVTIGQLNGSGTRSLTAGLAPSWEPNGGRIVFNHVGALYVVHPDGSLLRVLTGSYRTATWPEWSSDGWIYFQGQPTNESSLTWVARVRPDGSGLETLSAEPAVYPTASPDGKQVGWVNGGVVHVMDIETRTIRRLNTVGASTPRWSPDGRWIAYISGGAAAGVVRLIRPDGSESVAARVPSRTGLGIGWSPDSRFVVVYRTLIDVTTSVAVTLPWIGESPAWRR